MCYNSFVKTVKAFFRNLFSKDETNIGRQIEADLIKAICIIGMIFVHVFENFAYIKTGSDTAIYTLLRVGNTIFGASLFMFCMGLGMNYTKKKSPNDFIFRGIKLFVFGLLLNFFRAGLLLIIGRLMDPSMVLVKDIIYQLFEIDILIFAGLSLILFGLLRKIKTPIWAILLLSVVMSILGTVFHGYDLGNEFLNCLVGLFIGTYADIQFNTASCFPLFNWFIIIVAGYCFAYILKRVTNKNRFYLVFSSIALVVVALYIGFCIGPKVGYFQEDFICTFHIATYDALISICGAVFAFGLFYFISKILPKFLISNAQSLSKLITVVYCIQWLIIGNTTVLVEGYYPDLEFKKYQLALFGLGILIVSILLAILVKKICQKIKNNKKQTNLDAV